MYRFKYCDRYLEKCDRSNGRKYSFRALQAKDNLEDEDYSLTRDRYAQ